MGTFSKFLVLSLVFSFLLIPLASGASYRGIITTGLTCNTGLNSVFLTVRVYRVSTGSPNFMFDMDDIPNPPIRYPPDNGWWNNWTDYLFYINGSGAYLVETITPDSPSPVRFTSPSYAYEGSGRFTWYLILDHNATPLRLSPRHAIGIYRFNGSCLERTAVENSTEFPWQLEGSKYAVIEEYKTYMLFDPEVRGSLGWTPFNVSKALINRYFGSNTTRNSLFGMVFMNRSAILIGSMEGFFEGNGSYYFLKPVKFNPAGFNYTVIKSYPNWSEIPYYGVLIYPQGFVPLLEYDPTKSGRVILAPNVKPFKVPPCGTSNGSTTGTRPLIKLPASNNGSSRSPSGGPPMSETLLGGISGVVIGLMIGAIVGRRGERHEED